MFSNPNRGREIINPAKIIFLLGSLKINAKTEAMIINKINSGWNRAPTKETIVTITKYLSLIALDFSAPPFRQLDPNRINPAGKDTTISGEVIPGMVHRNKSCLVEKCQSSLS